MADDLLGRLSGTSDPYAVNTHTLTANEKNTLTITDYFKLLATQLANQNMTSPIGSSEMMMQVTQMAVTQAISTMTESVQTSASVSTQVYATGLVGQEITVTVTEESVRGQPITIDAQYGRVESVDFIGGTPVLKLVGDDDEYPLSYALGMGKIDNPYKRDENDGKQTKEDDAENEKTDSPSNEYTIREDNPLVDKDIFT